MVESSKNILIPCDTPELACAQDWLEPHETIEGKLHKNNRIPFRLKDIVRVTTGFALFIAGCLSQNGPSLYYRYIGLILIVVSVNMIFVHFFLRWYRTKQLTYYVTSHRLIIYNRRHSTIQNSFPFADLPEMTLRENAFNRGFIILGDLAPDYATTISIFGIRSGLNIADHALVLENLPNVRKTYNLLMTLAERPEKKYVNLN